LRQVTDNSLRQSNRVIKWNFPFYFTTTASTVCKRGEQISYMRNVCYLPVQHESFSCLQLYTFQRCEFSKVWPNNERACIRKLCHVQTLDVIWSSTAAMWTCEYSKPLLIELQLIWIEIWKMLFAVEYIHILQKTQDI
jgi:hypothetical protein